MTNVVRIAPPGAKPRPREEVLAEFVDEVGECGEHVQLMVGRLKAKLPMAHKALAKEIRIAERGLWKLALALERLGAAERRR